MTLTGQFQGAGTGFEFGGIIAGTGGKGTGGA